jgi:acetyl esterase/lipase
MKKSYLVPAVALVLVLFGASQVMRAQGSESHFDRMVRLASTYSVNLNVPYRQANNWEGKLDIIRPRDASGPTPTVLFFHGGGWTGGSKDGGITNALPYLEMGYAVVNVAYRLAAVSLAPAAVEDTRCALRWVYRNAKQYNFDVNRIVLTGQSAGGHLSLITGMLPPDTPLDLGCPGDRGSDPVNTAPLKVAAIVNWYGITDVTEMLNDGANRRAYAVMWMGSMPNRKEIADMVSPLKYVRAGLPPIMMIHGDADPTVPYTQAQRLDQALDKAGVPNEFFTVPGGKHGGFTVDEYLKAYAAIRAFLTKHVGGTVSTAD